MESAFLLWCKTLLKYLKEKLDIEQCPVPELMTRLLQIIHRPCLCHFRSFSSYEPAPNHRVDGNAGAHTQARVE